MGKLHSPVTDEQNMKTYAYPQSKDMNLRDKSSPPANACRFRSIRGDAPMWQNFPGRPQVWSTGNVELLYSAFLKEQSQSRQSENNE